MLLRYIDNEVPGFGEWDSVYQESPATAQQLAAAAWTERGGVGARITIADGKRAYLRRDFTCTIPAGGTLFVGCWHRWITRPSAVGQTLYEVRFAGSEEFGVRYNTVGSFILLSRNDANTVQYIADYIALPAGWVYIVMALGRATTDVSSDGWMKFYVGGTLRGTKTGIDNFDRYAGTFNLRWGRALTGGSALVCDFDEIKVGTTLADVESYAREPSGEHVEPRRTVVILPETADGRDFGDYMSAQAGVPYANRLFIPDLSTSETLATYAAFKTAVEDKLTEFLANYPVVAARCAAFLLGPGVPGYFNQNGTKYSATSRMMDYPNVFSPDKANPLYVAEGLPASRLSVSQLRAAGAYLASRIDADTLANAKKIVDAGLAAEVAEVAEEDILYTDDTDYRVSLPCQHLRIITSSLAEFAADAFIWGETGTPEFGAGGSRVCFAGLDAGSADSLRTGGCPCQAALNNLYSSALGFSSLASGLRPSAFFEALRLEGSLSEASAVAAQYVNSTLITAGLPWLAVGFQVGGYTLYRGLGGPDSIDYGTPVAYLRSGVSGAVLAGLGHQVGVQYWYGVRAVSSAGVEEVNTTVVYLVEIDADGNLKTPLPNAVSYAYARQAAGGKMRLDFFYSAYGQAAAPAAVQVAEADDGGAYDFNSPIQTVAISGTCRRSLLLDKTWADGAMVRLAVRAVTAGGRGGPVLVVEPIRADAVGPAAVEWLEAEQI